MGVPSPSDHSQTFLAKGIPTRRGLHSLVADNKIHTAVPPLVFFSVNYLLRVGCWGMLSHKYKAWIFPQSHCIVPSSRRSITRIDCGIGPVKIEGWWFYTSTKTHTNADFSNKNTITILLKVFIWIILILGKTKLVF